MIASFGIPFKLASTAYKYVAFDLLNIFLFSVLGNPLHNSMVVFMIEFIASCVEKKFLSSHCDHLISFTPSPRASDLICQMVFWFTTKIDPDSLA